MSKAHALPLSLISALMILAPATADGASAHQAVAPHIGQARQHSRHSHRHRKPSKLTTPMSVGAQGRTGPTGTQGVQGPQGAIGPAGPQGPGASGFVYDSSAPAATEQNTPLGSAGPFKLTGSCVQLGAKLVVVELGATNATAVQFDQLRTEEDGGSPAVNTFERPTQGPTVAPLELFAAASTNVGSGETYASGRLTLTSPVHGQLEVFEYVSELSNVCHISALWVPAS